MLKIRLLVLLLVSSAMLLGCGNGGPKMSKVTGTVTLDGADLEEGGINFIPSDGKGVSAGAKIVKGKYSAEIPYGPKRIEIRARKVTGSRPAYEGDPKSPMIETFVELIPTKYNSESILVWTIEAEETEVNLPLESPPPGTEEKKTPELFQF